MSALQKIVGAILVIVGAILTFTGIGAPIGIPMMISGTTMLIQAFFFAPKAPEASEDRESATYGFRQFENPVKGDSAIPVIFSNNPASATPGHRTAGVVISAFTTPKGSEDPEFVKALKARGQALSVLLAIAEGPIEDIADIRVNDEPVFEEVTDKAPAESANGTRRDFTWSGKRIDLKSFRLFVGGVAKGWTRSTITEQVAVGTATSTAVAYRVKVSEVNNGAQVIDDARDVRFFLGPAATSAYLLPDDETAEVRCGAWIGGSENELIVWPQAPIPNGKKLWVEIPVRRLEGATIKRSSDGKAAIVSFVTAPASGTTIRANFRRALMLGVRVEWRNGGRHQLPIDGHDAIRNTVSVQGGPLPLSTPPTTFTTDEDVDDVIVDLASVSGFTAIDSKDGGRSPVRAQIKIEWKKSTEADSAYRKLRDPAGEVIGPDGGKKTTYEFQLTGDSVSQLYWSFSILGLLKRWCEDHPTDSTAKTELAAFTRGKYTVRVTRTNKVQADSSTYVQDEIEVISYQKILYERLSYPGTALLSFHGIASEKLQGSLPRITCRVVGLNDVEEYAAGAWTRSATAQKNRVWAAIHIITARRYGAGEQYSKADNIDTASAATAAAWCDATVTHGEKSEARSVLDIVLDTRKSLMEQVRDILAPGRVVPVLRGNVWYFLVDREVTLSTVPVLYDDGSDARTVKGSARLSHDPVSSRVTELQVSYLDAEDDWERNEVWVAPRVPATERRIERAQAYGVTRATEAERYATWLYARQAVTPQPRTIGWSMPPSTLSIEAGDVVRVVSDRLDVDMYVRVMAVRLSDSDDYMIDYEGVEYVPAVYGQSLDVQVTTRSAQASGTPSLSSPSTTKTDGTGAPALAPVAAVTIRRVR